MSTTRSESAGFPELPSDGNPFSRLGLPADEAMDDFDHMRTSTAASEVLMAGIGDEMKGFILSDTDDDSLSLPPGLAGEDTLPFQRGSTPGEYLNDMLPSSLLPTEESDSQKTRFAQEPMSAMSFRTERTKSDQSGFVLSSEGNPDEEKTNAANATEDSLENGQSVDYYGASPIPQHRKASATATKPDSHSENPNPAAQKSTQPSLAELIERSKTESTRQSRLGSEVAESVIQWEAGNDRGPVPNAPPDCSHNADDHPAKVGTKRPSLKQQSPRKRPRKNGPTVIPPLPGMGGPETGRRALPSMPPVRSNVSCVSELSEPRAPSRRPSSVYIDDNGSPIPEFDQGKRPTNARTKAESFEIQPSVSAQLRRSSRIKKQATGSPTSTVSTFPLDASKQKKTPPVLANQVNETFPALPKLQKQNQSNDYAGTTLPPLRENRYPQTSSSSTPPTPVAPMPPQNFNMANAQDVASAKTLPEVENPFSLRPGGKKPKAREEYIPMGVICQPEPSGLRSQITRQIQERENKKRRIDPREDPVVMHVPGIPQRQVATSPLVAAVHQTTSGIFKYVQTQDTIVQRVADEYRKQTMILIQNTRALHAREAHEAKKHLEENHSAFVDMCRSTLAQIREAKISLAQKKETMRQTKHSDVDQFGAVVEGVAKSLQKLQASLGADETMTVDPMSMEKLQQEISRMIDEAGLGVETEKSKRRKKA